MERYTEYHFGKAVIRNKEMMSVAMEKLANYEDQEFRKNKAEVSIPDFPRLKNNDQRRRFLQKYKEWPVWLEVKETDETYYRYNLPDGSSIVIKEFKKNIAENEYFVQITEKDYVIITEYFLVIPGYRFLHDCKASGTQIIEHLKNVQKGIKQDG